MGQVESQSPLSREWSHLPELTPFPGPLLDVTAHPMGDIPSTHHGKGIYRMIRETPSLGIWHHSLDEIAANEL